MSDIIQLLPDSVASQIAAGEVIQRPASALKEILENSVDSGATRIQVILKDAGKSLIQVVDNGCGMSDNDSRLCFERHATSKIRKAEDLFAIRTMGFRGEALASIAAIAMVEMRTKQTENETGIQIIIEGCELKSQTVVSCPDGTSISVRNLFFNIPARRNFLKSNAAELRHLIEEFQRVALAYPAVALSLHHDGNELFRLHECNFRQRIAAIFGSNYNERLVPVEEETASLRISGFIIKPEFSKKTRGEQYFMVNGRYIKDAYLHHAVCSGFDELLASGTYPSYFINISVDPSIIDVNIHPTKTEIKFEDERLVYSIMKASVKRALGKFSISPSLDFEQERGFNVPLSRMKELPVQPSITVNKNYNPFLAGRKDDAAAPAIHRSVSGWENLYSHLSKADTAQIKVEVPSKLNFEQSMPDFMSPPEVSGSFVFSSKYLMIRKQGEVIFADRQAAMERIYYEQMLEQAMSAKHTSQQNLFPQAIEFTPADFVALGEMGSGIRNIGFDIREFGKNTYVIHGLPYGTEITQAKSLLEEILEDYKHHADSFKTGNVEQLARTIARYRARHQPMPGNESEVRQIIADLLKCENPNYSFTGRKIFLKLNEEDLTLMFEKQKTPV